MEQLEALKELAEKVEAGDVPNATDIWNVVVFEDNKVKASKTTISWALSTVTAFHGSLDAAHSLHKAVLPEWGWLIEYEEAASNVSLYSPDGRKVIIDIDDFIGEPARAWLLAIIKAKIQELEQ